MDNKKKTDKANQQKWIKDHQERMKQKNLKAVKGNKGNR